MRLRPRFWMLLIAAAVATASVTAGLAQTPSGSASSPSEGEPAETPPDTSPGKAGEAYQGPRPKRLDLENGSPEIARPARDTEAKERIERALRGEPVDATGGDPVLEDVLKIIRGRGSILDGSVLDTGAADIAKAETPERDSAVGRRNARVAEMLLKTSRLLENIEPVDQTRRELVTAMRAEAVRVLSP